MSKSNATIAGYQAAMRDAEEMAKFAYLALACAERQVRKAQDELVAAKELVKRSRDILNVCLLQDVREEVTQRHVDIAHMKGISLRIGEELTPVVKAMIFQSHV